ncbi:MAG: hypothetical protein ACRCZ4_00190 [Plesiomonas sp.]|uniref:hypothetical protein n=1 Tax=Plesiomonas sp. TaxID=2486279 RepID=UPI003F2A4467
MEPLLDSAIKLPKIVLPIHREIAGKVKNITVSLCKTGKYYPSSLADDGIGM